MRDYIYWVPIDLSDTNSSLSSVNFIILFLMINSTAAVISRSGYNLNAIISIVFKKCSNSNFPETPLFSKF